MYSVGLARRGGGNCILHFAILISWNPGELRFNKIAALTEVAVVVNQPNEQGRQISDTIPNRYTHSSP